MRYSIFGARASEGEAKEEHRASFGVWIAASTPAVCAGQARAAMVQDRPRASQAARAPAADEMNPNGGFASSLWRAQG